MRVLPKIILRTYADSIAFSVYVGARDGLPPHADIQRLSEKLRVRGYGITELVRELLGGSSAVANSGLSIAFFKSDKSSDTTQGAKLTGNHAPAIVAAVFQSLLGREPDERASVAYSAALLNHLSLEEFIAEVAASDEFMEKHRAGEGRSALMDRRDSPTEGTELALLNKVITFLGLRQNAPGVAQECLAIAENRGVEAALDSLLSSANVKSRLRDSSL